MLESLRVFKLRAYVGRQSLTFLAASLRGENGGTAPDAFPTETIVPFRRINSKLASKLQDPNQIKTSRS